MLRYICSAYQYVLLPNKKTNEVISKHGQETVVTPFFRSHRLIAKLLCKRAFSLFAMAILATLVSCTTITTDRHHYIVNAGSNQVEVIAEGKGPLLVLLPSAARGADDFDEVAPMLADKGFRVIRPEPRGSGRTTGPYAGISLHDVANDVAAVIRQENNGPAILVGHAAGSFVARVLAVDHPELVRGVVLAAAGAWSYPRELGIAVRKMDEPNITDTERLKYLRSSFFAPGSDATVWLKGWRPLIQYGAGGAPDNASRDQWWGAGNKPVLEIQPLDDPFKPRSAAGEFKAEFGDRVTVVEIANASHALFPEQPKAVVNAIVKWAVTLDSKP